VNLDDSIAQICYTERDAWEVLFMVRKFSQLPTMRGLKI